jgi:hypothetical protein
MLSTRAEGALPASAAKLSLCWVLVKWWPVA